MCPDIENFAPLIQATFGGHGLTRARRGPERHPRDPAGRPLAPPDQPRDGRPGRGARARHGAGSRRPRSSTWPAASRCAAGSSSATTICPGWRSGSTSACVRWGFDAEHRERVPARGHRGQHVAGGAGPDPARGGHGRRAPAALRRRRSLSTTSTAATSSWPAAWRSSSIGCAGARRARRHAARSTSGPTTLAAHLRVADGDDARPTPGSAPSSRRCSTSWSARPRTETRRSAVALSCDDVRSILSDRLQGPADAGQFLHRAT